MSAIKNFSLYVPHVFPNFNKEYIANAFKSFGEIDHIDVVGKQDRNGKDYNAVYVHFNMWYDTSDNYDFQRDLLNSEARVYYDGPWYWIVLPNTAKKYNPGDRKPRIDLGETMSISVNTPEKVNKVSDCPAAPKKLVCSDTFANVDDVSVKLESVFEEESWDIEASEEEAQMAEIEVALEEDDANLVHVDRRYIQVVEEENMWLRNEVVQLRMALINMDQMYQAEAAKVRAFTLNQEVNIIEEE